MKYFDTTNVVRQWDRFDAFYWKWNCFIRFETGEVMLDTGSTHADHRTMYTPMNVRICSTSNMYDKLYTPEGEPVTIASLERNGIQSFLVDYDHKRAVVFNEGYKVSAHRFTVNRNMAIAGVFYMREDDTPHSQSLVEVGTPLLLNKERQEWRAEVMEFVKPMYELQKDEASRVAYNGRYKYRKGVSITATDYTLPPTDFVAGLELERLYFLNHNGFATSYNWASYDHLIIK